MSETKKHTNKVSKEHKYRVSLYLGKDLYNTLNGMARFMNIPLATATRILLETGVKLGSALDSKGTEDLRRYGKSEK